VTVLGKLKSWLVRDRTPTWATITLSSDGFAVGSRLIEWADITSVTAFKRDMLTFDDVWFQVDGSGESIMVCEEHPGFSEWEAALATQFPSAQTWREVIIKPAFAENRTVLYERT
jgi:hypothetical protein